MFKVSLLPASYRKYLEGKKKKDLILKVALLVLACMLVIYAGFYVRTLILKNHIKNIDRQNSVIVAEINELQRYKTIYDELVLSQNRINTIKPKEPSALKFLTVVQESRPEYIKINAVSLNDWQTNAVCVIEGELSAAQTLRDAVDHLRAYKEFVETDEAFEGLVTNVKLMNEMPSKVMNGGKAVYTFRMYVSLGGEIQMDESGNLITTTTTTTAPAETESTESTESTTVAE